MPSGPDDLDANLDDDLDDDPADEFEDDDFEEDEDEDEDDDDDDEDDDDPNADFELTEGWMQFFDHPHALTASINTKVYVGYLGGSQGSTDLPEGYPGWSDSSDTDSLKKSYIWITPETAQRFMDKATAEKITAEQALGWLLNRAYQRNRE